MEKFKRIPSPSSRSQHSASPAASPAVRNPASGADLQPPAFLEGLTAPAGRGRAGASVRRPGGAAPGETESRPGRRRAAPGAEITQVQLQKSSRKPKLLPHNFGLTSLLLRHTLRPSARPPQSGGSKGPPALGLPVPGARAPRVSPRTQGCARAPAERRERGPIQSLPELSRHSTSLSRCRKQGFAVPEEERDAVASQAAGAGAQSEEHRGRAPPPPDLPGVPAPRVTKAAS